MKGKLRTSLLLTLLVLTLIIPAMTVTANLQLSGSFNGRITKFVLPMGKPSSPPGLDKLKIEIVSPEDGATLTPDTYNVKIRATSKSVITIVQLEITNVGIFDIINNFDGTYYTYDWEASQEGPYTLTATVTDETEKTATDSIQVTIGEQEEPPAPANKWAVVVGIADYRGRANDLWHPDEDALEMVSVLEGNGYASDNIMLLLNREASASNIVNAINWIVINENADSEVVFFYSGHGARAPDYEGWDGDAESDSFDELIVTADMYGISDGQLAQLFSTVESTKFALMFGSCHSGGMFDDNDDLQGNGRIIASACKADQYGWDYLNLGNTLWGYYFIDEGLLQNNANSIETAHAHAYGPVTIEQPDSEPQLYDNFNGDFIL